MAEGGGEEEAAVRSTSAFLLASSGSGRRVKSPPPSATRVRLLLTRERLECSDEKQQQDHKATVTSGFLLEDLVGVDVRGRPPPHDKNACEMNVHFYPKQTEKKKTMRKMKVLSVCFDKAETLSENRAEASKWKDDIKLYSHYRRSQVLKIEDGEVQADGVPQRRLLVLINPISGQGKAVQDFQEHVQPLFELAEITFNAIVTERQNHARELMKEYDLSTVDGIVIASGDGLLYEVVNGMMEREDWEQALKTPIGMLPTGSGNALCASTLYEAGEEFSLVNAAFQIIQGGVIPMDITTVETADKQTLYMTILSGWGLISDIDIESESLRKIGETRFLLGALNCIRRKRVYRGRLVYLPWDESKAPDAPLLSRSVPTQATLSSSVPPGPPAHLVTSSLNPQLLSRGGGEHCSALPGGDTIDEAPNEEGPSPLQLSSEESEKEKSDVFGDTKDVVLEESSIRSLTGGAEGRLGDDGPVRGEKTDKIEDVTKDWEFVAREEKPAVKIAAAEPIQITSTSPVAGDQVQTPASLRSYASSGPCPDLLPEITEDVPDNWKTIEGDFLTVSPLMIPHLSSNFFGDPRMSIGTGKIRIMYVRRMSRLGLLSMLTKAEKGTHLDRQEVEIIDVKAFRLEPQTEGGILTVDGEVVKYGPMQAQVHQHLARVFCCKRV